MGFGVFFDKGEIDLSHNMSDLTLYAEDIYMFNTLNSSLV